MCNPYSMTTNVEAIRRLFGVDSANDYTGNLPAMPWIFPDYPAPIVRNGTRRCTSAPKRFAEDRGEWREGGQAAPCLASLCAEIEVSAAQVSRFLALETLEIMPNVHPDNYR